MDSVLGKCLENRVELHIHFNDPMFKDPFTYSKDVVCIELRKGMHKHRTILNTRDIDEIRDFTDDWLEYSCERSLLKFLEYVEKKEKE